MDTGITVRAFKASLSYYMSRMRAGEGVKVNGVTYGVFKVPNEGVATVLGKRDHGLGGTWPRQNGKSVVTDKKKKVDLASLREKVAKIERGHGVVTDSEERGHSEKCYSCKGDGGERVVWNGLIGEDVAICFRCYSRGYSGEGAKGAYSGLRGVIDI